MNLATKFAPPRLLLHSFRGCAFNASHGFVGRKPPGLGFHSQSLFTARRQLRQLPPRRWQSATAESASSAPPPQEPSSVPPRSLTVRILRFLFIAVSCTTAGFVMAASPAIPAVTEALSPPTDEQTLSMFTPDPADTDTSEIENALWSHPLVKALLTDSTLKPSRPHLKLPPTMRSGSLTGGTLLGQDKIAVPPLAFSTSDGSRFVSIQYLGPALCGHPGLVHGGLLATLLDEGLARCCFPALPNKVGVTASLKVDYRKPCKAGSFVVLRAETTKVDGRKAWVKGRLETLADESIGETPQVLVEAEALFIEPKQAASMARIYPTS